MHENIIPESVLEKIEDDGKIDEDISEESKLNYYEIYKKAYEDDKNDECVETLLKIAQKEPKTFKKSMLVSDSLKNPMGMKFGEKEFQKTMYILGETYNIAKKLKYPNNVLSVLREMQVYTYVFYNSNQKNSATSFWDGVLFFVCL